MMWGSFEERVVNLRNPREMEAVRLFLDRFGLSFDGNVDYTIALYQGEKIVATGSLAGEVLRNIAVDNALQGEGLTAAVVSNLMREAGRRGRYHYFIYTKPDKAHLFTALGFKEIASVQYAALLEAGLGSIETYCRELEEKVNKLPSGPRAVLVVNCNPFTLGHQAVIAKAAEENASVVVMVVSEDRSLFPFDVRFRLVQEGLKAWNNIVVIPGGKYIVSAATFPGYFTKGETTVAAQTELDAVIFSKYIAPALGVSTRYVGDEPYCQVTQAYNQAMAAVLPAHGIKLEIMPRISTDGKAISASLVRDLIRRDEWATIKSLVPETTYNYLVSPAAQEVIEKIKNTLSRH